MKNFRLTTLAEEIVKQPTIDGVPRYLVASLMQIYNKKKQDEQEKYNMYNLS